MSKNKNKKKTLYDDLEVSPLSNKQDIKKAFKKKMKKIHPDVGGDPEEFKQVVKAYLILSDAESRYKYDSTGEEEKPSDRKPVDLDKQAEMFLIRSVFNLIDKYNENIVKKNIQKELLIMLDSIKSEIKTRKKGVKQGWKTARLKYEGVKKKQSTIEINSLLYNILQQKLNNILNSELMKFRFEFKSLIRDSIVMQKVEQAIKNDCVDKLVEETYVDPLQTWDQNMAWRGFTGTSTF